MDVTIGGSCAKNNETRNICPKGQSCDDIIEQYPFFFALENSVSYFDDILNIFFRFALIMSPRSTGHVFIWQAFQSSLGGPSWRLGNTTMLHLKCLCLVTLRPSRSSLLMTTNHPKKWLTIWNTWKAMSRKEFFSKINSKYLRTAYAEYFAWRMDWTVAPWQTAGYRNGPCLLCEKLWQKEISSKSVSYQLISIFTSFL